MQAAGPPERPISEDPAERGASARACSQDRPQEFAGSCEARLARVCSDPGQCVPKQVETQ
eukprot:255390-Pyramimonas_sp.AAC.1